MAILPKGVPFFFCPKAAFGDWGFPSKRVLTSKRYACGIIAAAIYVSFSLLKRSFFERKCNLINACGHCARVCRCGIVTFFQSREGLSPSPMQTSRVIELTPLRRKTLPKGAKVDTLAPMSTPYTVPIRGDNHLLKKICVNMKFILDIFDFLIYNKYIVKILDTMYYLDNNFYGEKLKMG